MKASKALLAIVLLGMVAVAHADIIDPFIDVSDPPGCSPGHPELCPNPIFTPVSFLAITANQSGGGATQFTNLTGTLITSILFGAPTGGNVFVGNITCSTDSFVSCDIFGNNFTTFIYLSGIGCHGGAACGWQNNSIITVSLNDQKISNVKAELDLAQTGTFILKVGKRRFLKLVVEAS